MKGATDDPRFPDAAHPNFNPRTREGCDHFGYDVLGVIFFISIHAPVKGATIFPHNDAAVVDISIHAPVKGATLAEMLRITSRRVFQSTHP